MIAIKYAQIYSLISIIMVCLYGDIAKKHSRLISYKNLRNHHAGLNHQRYNHMTHSRNKRFIRRYLINDCEVSDWSEWSECDAYCGPGHSQRSRMLFSHPVGMKEQDGPKTKEIKTCIGQTCEDACKATEWSTWSECSVTCGLGSRIKSRSASEKDPHPMCSRLQLTKYDKCSIAPCEEEINCNKLKWTAWSQCDKTCGHGQQERRRFNQSQTNECKPDVRPCNSAECDKDCEVSKWTGWSKCDLQCNKKRTRTKLHDEAGNGKSCKKMRYVQTTACTDGCSPCENTAWTDWSSCSINLPCHNGTMLRIRSRKKPKLGTCIVRMQKDYKNCTVTEGCNNECVYTQWSKWSPPCDNLSCTGKKVSARKRSIQQKSLEDGTPCKSKYLREEKTCARSSICIRGVRYEKTTMQPNTVIKNNDIKTNLKDSYGNKVDDMESGYVNNFKNQESTGLQKESIADASIGSIAICKKSTSFKNIFLIAALCLSFRIFVF